MALPSRHHLLMDIYIGFDSAWTDKLSAPGAITALAVEEGRAVRFEQPRLASFTEALSQIKEWRTDCALTLVAIDQPTVVPNHSSMRPVERVAATLVSWAGGGVQPANRGRKGMFCDDSPIWSFLTGLSAIQDPERAITAREGLFLMEVFPAIALPSLSARFYGRYSAPKYNPAQRKKFTLTDWQNVCLAVQEGFDDLKFLEPAAWCGQLANATLPRKSDQDKLDAMICLLIALKWRLRPREASLMIGSLQDGYMVLPASLEVRSRLLAAALKYGVALDGSPRD